MDWTKERATDQPNLFAKPRLILGSPWEFKKYGQCGMDVSDLFPHLATCVDDMAFVRSVQTESGNHPAAVFAMNTGPLFPVIRLLVPGRPLGQEVKTRTACIRGAPGLSLSSVQRLTTMGKRIPAVILPRHGAALERPAYSRSETTGNHHG